MFDRGVLTAVPALALWLLACAQTPEQVNRSGHEPYLSGDYEAALEAYREAQELDPETGAPYYNAGNAWYRMEEYEEALREYDKSLRYAEGELRSDGFFNRGNAYFQMQQYAQAVEAYKEVLRMNPDDISAKHSLELALARLPPPEPGQDPDQGERPGPQEQDQRQDSQGEQQEEIQDDEGRQQRPQSEPITEEQARQILETVAEDARTLQEHLQQVLVSPNSTPESDW